MTDDKIVDALWDSHAQGDFFPEAWIGKLDLDQAYRVQLGLLDKKVAQGEQQAGWKVGLTADAMREMFGGKEPVFGHLLESSAVWSGHAFEFAGLRNAKVENELLITMDTDLSGPDVTLAQARQAMREIAPALEIVELRGADMRVDIPLAITDNVAQFAFVHGEAMMVLPDFDFTAVQAEVRVNGEVRDTAIGGDVMDNQVQTVAWLANALHRYGRKLHAGQRIMSGSFTTPIEITAGDTVETHFTGVGSVTASFL